MRLPPRVHFTLHEAAARWECTLADDVRRFETDCDLLRRPAAHIGSAARYDWEACTSP